MMKKLKIYLDTSVINFLFADDAPDLKKITVDFFENFIDKSIYDTYISAYVIEEINATKDENKREMLLDVIKRYPIDFVKEQSINNIQELADIYVEDRIIPSKKYMDAYHIAVSVVNDMDYLVSWNYKHLANVNKENQVRIANL